MDDQTAIRQISVKSQDIIKQVQSLIMREVKQSAVPDRNVLMLTTVIGTMEMCNSTLESLKVKMPNATPVIDEALKVAREGRKMIITDNETEKFIREKYL